MVSNGNCKEIFYEPERERKDKDRLEIKQHTLPSDRVLGNELILVWSPNVFVQLP